VANAPAAWYPDPYGERVLRWWDGNQWTPNTHPLEAAVSPAEAPPARPLTPESPPTSSAAPQPPPGSWPSVGVVEQSRGGLFGGRKHVEEENERLKALLAGMGVVERDRLTAEVETLRTEVAGLERTREGLSREVGDARDGLALRERLGKQIGGLETAVAALNSEQQALALEVVETREAAILQEVGIYCYRHPLDDAVAFKARLIGIQARIKDAAKAGTAVQGSTSWTVNGSAREGSKMVREFSKLMLRAYNNEADNAVRSMKPYTLDSSIARLVKARETISKLGGTMNIRITDSYHALRLQELELTADYLAKSAEEKEREREERARLKDEEQARREIAREQERLQKEHDHYRTVLAQFQAQGNHAAATDAEEKLTQIGDSLDGLSRRAANIRAGYVYVISNYGAFGPKMVKIGLTRRLDPMDRVRELGDASVPFRYDVHALVFSEDAVGLETHLHHTLADRRVNRVNNRREFFYARPDEVKAILKRLDTPMLSYVDEPEALEWRQSETDRASLAK
jgi:Domain of unknown function (DUF4041)/T5orf172 domain/Protein of unknown function (DUF2510)